MKNSIILSIIVPVYNVEAFLPQCLDSLLNQNLDSAAYEIILIDDGSQDKCPEICDKYAEKHAIFRVLHQKNAGLSAARNRGIESAQGKYIIFVDSDDYLQPNVLSTLITRIEANCLDILRFNYQNVDEKNKIIETYYTSKLFVDYREDVCDGSSFLTERLGFACYAWQFIFRRSLLENCVFKEGLLFEDTEWTPRVLLKANRVSSTMEIVYNYRMRQGSITKSIGKNKRLKVLENRIRLIDFLKEQKQSVEDKRWFDGMIAHTSLAIISDVSHVFFKNRKYYIKILQRKDVFPLSKYHASVLAARKIRVANISPMLLCILLHLKNKE